MTFTYHEPASVDEVIARLDDTGEAMVLAGGVTLARQLKQDLIRPRQVIGLRRLVGLREIRRNADGLWIGALATHRDVERSPAVRAHHSALADAFSTIGSVRIRNQATLGGNLAAPEPSHDPPVVLMAFDAALVLTSAGGDRREISPAQPLPIHYLIVAVTVPPVPPGTRATYLKYRPRSDAGQACVSVAATLRLDGRGQVAHSRIVLGAAGPAPVRAHAAERVLQGERPTEPRLRAAAAHVTDEIDPVADTTGSAEYKRAMAVVWTCRALRQLVSSDPTGSRPGQA